VQRAPVPLAKAVRALLTLAIDMDTGSPFESSAKVLLYIVRHVARIESAFRFLLDQQRGTHVSIRVPLRGVNLTASEIATLEVFFFASIDISFCFVWLIKTKLCLIE
jgi:hypothetical protein